MDVHRQPVGRTFAHGLVQPLCPLRAAHLHKSELQSADAPLSVDGQQFVQLPCQSPLVDVYPDANSLLPCVVADVLHPEVACGGRLSGVALHLPFRSVPSGIQLHIFDSEVGAEIDAAQDACLVQARTAEGSPGQLGGPRCHVGGGGFAEVQYQLFMINEVYGTFGSHDDSPGRVVGRDEIHVSVELHLQFVVPLEDELPSWKIDESGFEQSHVGAALQPDEQRPFALHPRLPQGSHLIGPLCPFFVPCDAAFRHPEGGAFAGDVEEEAIAGFGKVVAQRHALVVGSDDDVHGVELAFVVALNDGSLPVRPLLEVERELAVVVAYAAVLSIGRDPCGVLLRLAAAAQFEVAAPVLVVSSRNRQRGLEQLILDVHPQTAGAHDGVAAEGDAVAHGPLHGAVVEPEAPVGALQRLGVCQGRQQPPQHKQEYAILHATTGGGCLI